MSGKRKNFWDRLTASSLSWTPGGRRLIDEIQERINSVYRDGYEDGKAAGFVAGVQAQDDEGGI